VRVGDPARGRSLGASLSTKHSLFATPTVRRNFGSLAGARQSTVVTGERRAMGDQGETQSRPLVSTMFDRGLSSMADLVAQTPENDAACKVTPSQASGGVGSNPFAVKAFRGSFRPSLESFGSVVICERGGEPLESAPKQAPQLSTRLPCAVTQALMGWDQVHALNRQFRRATRACGH